MLVEIQSDFDEISHITETLLHHSQSSTEEIQSLATQTSALRTIVDTLSPSSSNMETVAPITQASFDHHSPPSSNDDMSLHTPVSLSEFDQTSNVSETHSDKYPDEISVNINNLEIFLQREIQHSNMDSIKNKDDGNFRLIFQNPNGIKIYQERDPEYLPSMESLKAHKADMICLAETNVPWHKSDFLYDISKQNQATWQGLPTKTVAASCRSEKKTQGNYLPGGVLTVVTDTMTTKIKNVQSDPLGRWTKVNFFAVKGTVTVYTIYRPNKTTIKTAGADTVWMQQHRALIKEKDKSDPRTQLIKDLIADIQASNNNGNNEFILAGDFNEDPSDNEDDGINTLMLSCGLENVFDHLHNALPSTRNNTRSIDHILVSQGIKHTIVKAGLVPKEIGFNTSDHQAIFVDFLPSVLETKNIPLQPPSTRKLRLHNAPKVEWYILKVLERAGDQNIMKRLDRLHESIKVHSFDSDAQKELELIDKQMTDIMLKTETELSPDSTPYAFSIELMEQIQQVRLLKRMLKLREQGKTRQIQEMVAFYPDTDELQTQPISDLKMLLYEERQELKNMQEEAEVHREKHMDDIYTKAAELFHKDKMTVIKMMKEREKQKRLYQKIAFVLKSIRAQNLTRLGIPKGMMQRSTREIWDFLQIKEKKKEKIEWEYTEDDTIIKFRLREWNIIHFNQSSETPLASQMWEDKLAPDCLIEENIHDVLQQAIDSSDDLHQASKCLLQEMKRKISSPMPDTKTSFTVEEFRSFYRKTPEDRSSSPSGLHIGHYKAAALDQDFSNILCSIASIALEQQYALQRWKHSATILLEKSAGNPHIHKFRTIHLIESDLNYVMRKIWGRDFMHHNEALQTFHDNQYGGRKGRLPTSAILNKVLTLDIIRYFGDDMVIIDNDAKACYDRVIPYVTLYMLYRLGMPVFLSKFMCNMLRQTYYTIKTGTGNTEPYSSTDARLFGTGQGAGWSPPCWAANSDVISCVMERHTPGMLLEHPNKKIVSHRHIDAFVDDSSLGITRTAYDKFEPLPDDPVQKGQDLYDQARLNTQFYSRLLFTTGGLLAIHKCLAYILLFIWVDGVKRLQKVKDQYEPIQVQQGIHQEFDCIAIMDPDEAFRMLGGFVAPDGNTKVQVEILYKKAKAWAVRISGSYLNAHEAYMAFHQVLLPALIYPLGAIPVQEHDCIKIMGPALKALLPKLGFSQTLARELVHANPRHGGLDITHLYTHAGTSRIKMFLGHWRRHDETSKILKISLGCCQQEVGIGPRLLQQDFKKYGWILQSCWVKELWRFLYDINGSIVIAEEWEQQACKNDLFLMQIVHNMALSKDQIHKINLCRLHKRITFLSEILHHDHTDFEPTLWDPNQQSHASPTERFPLVVIPKAWWTLWQTVLMAIKSSHQIAIHNLGPHLSPATVTWLTTTDFRYLYRKCNTEYTVHKLLHHDKNKFYYDVNSLFQTTLKNFDHLSPITPAITAQHILVKHNDKQPFVSATNIVNTISHQASKGLHYYHKIRRSIQSRSNAKPIIPREQLPPMTNIIEYRHYDVEEHSKYRNWWNINRPMPSFSITKQTPLPLPIYFEHPSELDITFLEAIRKLPPPILRNLGSISIITHLPSLIIEFEQNNVLAVCDASVSGDDYGSHAYTIVSKNESQRLKGCGPVDSDEDDIESTRAEKSGVLALTTLVGIFDDIADSGTRDISIFCDNQEAVAAGTRKEYLRSYVRYIQPNYDLDAEIVQSIKSSVTTINLVHLKGHQDDDRNFDYDTAPLSVRLNIDMDYDAKRFLKQYDKKLFPTRNTPFYPASEVALCIHDTVVGSNFDEHIQLHKHGPGLESRLVNKGILQLEHLPWIQWRGLERAMRRLKSVKKAPMMRIIHSKWSTAEAIADWYDEQRATCLRCKIAVETRDHVYQCKSEHGRKEYEKACQQLRTSLTKAKTIPMIMNYLLHILKEQRVGYDLAFKINDFYSDQIKEFAHKIYKKQIQVGRDSLSRGFLIKEWETLQNICVDNTNTTGSNIEWASQVINALWIYSKSIWDARSKFINEPNDITKKSPKTTELLRVLDQELKAARTRPMDYDMHQLLLNIESRKKKAKEHMLYKFLDTLRHQKEADIKRRRQENIGTPRAQSIRRWCARQQST